jgi:hypothetical protein
MSILKLITSKRLLIFAVIGLVMIGALITPSSPSAEAAETVYILSQTVYCDRIDVTYEVIFATSSDYAIITSHAGNTQLGSVNGTGYPSGVYSATVPVSPAQPSGTSLRVEIEINNGSGYFVNRVGTAEACTDDSGGGGGGGGTEEPPDDGEEENPPWPGYTDGRLSPDMAEYYTVYCSNDKVRVVRANPPPSVTLTEIPILTIMGLNTSGGSLNRDGINIVRNEDEISLSGVNGNSAPLLGTKTFNLSDCIERNGHEPEIPNHAPTITAESRSLFISVGDTGALNFRVNDLDHDRLTISVRVVDPSVVLVIYTPEPLEWDATLQHYGYPHIGLSNLETGDQTSVIVTVTDSQGASSSMTFNVIAPGRPDSFGPFSHLADLFFSALTNLLRLLCGIPVASVIVIPMASIAYSKRQKKN